MSISFDIYNAEEEWADLSKWESDHFLPIGDPETVIATIDQLFSPRVLDWMYHDDSADAVKDGTPLQSSPYARAHSALGDRNCAPEEEYIELYVSVHTDGYVSNISARKGSPSLVHKIMEAFELKYVFEMESMQLWVPELKNGNWEFVSAKKTQPT